VGQQEDKKLFMIASAIDARVKWFEHVILKIAPKSAVFIARDGIEAIDKLQNYPPHVLVADLNLPKMPGLKLIDQALKIKATQNTAIIIASMPQAQSRHVDELVSGKVQYFTGDIDEAEFTNCINKALMFHTQTTTTDFKLVKIPAGTILLNEGDRAEHVYFVKSGRLVAYRDVDGKEVVLGHVEYGEFVGEMAYINGEARNASVRALADCELIEVPMGRFEKVLFKQPAWSKALMMTLTKRLKAANEDKKTGE
jgi:CRP/FNR family transcriptional regulator, cyclic AMP receptor protein